MVKNVLEIRKKCPLCNSKDIKKIFTKKFNQIKTKQFFKTHLNNKFPMRILNNKNYEICECQNCKLLFQKNILNKEYNRKFYNDYIDHNKILNNKNIKKQTESYLQSEINLINKIFNSKKIAILEYGAGLGAWVSSLRKAGYKKISTVEISKKRRKYLKKKDILNFSSLKGINKRFDLIYSDQTFEHLSQPGKIISDLSKLLKPNGFLIFKIPPGNFLKKKLNDNYIAGKDEATPLEHINIYTKDTIKFITSRYKLKNIKYFFLFKFYDSNFLKFLISYFYHLYVGKKFILQKKR